MDTEERTFAQLLAFHLTRGTRPNVSDRSLGQAWSDIEFADQVGADPRSLRNWLKGTTVPVDMQKIESALFGFLRPGSIDPHLAWRLELRKAHRAVALGRKSRVPESVESRYLAEESHRKALADFTQAIEHKPNLASAYYSRGTLHAAEGRHASAIADFTEAIKSDPNDAMAYNNRGEAYLANGQPDHALFDFNEAIRLDPLLAAAFYNRALTHQAVGHLDKAIADFDAVADAFYKRGEAWLREGDQPHATVAFAQAVRLNPDIANRLKTISNLSEVALSICDDIKLYRALFQNEGPLPDAPKSPDELLNRYLAAAGISESLRANVSAQIRKLVTEYGDIRPKWCDRNKFDNLKFLNAPMFLRTVYHDAFGQNGALIDEELVRRSDPQLVKLVQQYIIKRIERDQDLGDAKGLVFTRPDARSNSRQIKPRRPGTKRQKTRPAPARG